jgi:hypothetical protein
MTPMTTRVLRKDFLKKRSSDSHLLAPLSPRITHSFPYRRTLLNMRLCFMSAARLTG